MTTHHYEGAEVPQDLIDRFLENPRAVAREIGSALPDLPAEEANAVMSELDAAFKQVRRGSRPRIADRVRARWPSPEPPVQWIAEGLVPEGRLMGITGRGAAGKTTVLAAICAAIAAGWKRLLPSLESEYTGPVNRLAPDPAPILWATWETAEGDFSRRLTGVVNLGNEEYAWDALGDRFHFVDMGDFGPAYVGDRQTHGITDYGRELLDYAEDMDPKPALLVMDPRRGAFNAEEIDFAPVSHWNRTILRPWCKRTGITVCQVHHPNQTGEGIAGNQDWRNSLLVGLALTDCQCETCDTERKTAKSQFRRPRTHRLLTSDKENEAADIPPIPMCWDALTGTFAIDPGHRPDAAAPRAAASNGHSSNGGVTYDRNTFG